MKNKDKKIKHKNGISAYYVENQNKWRAYITLPDGSGKRKDFYGKTRKEAEDKAQEFLNNGCKKKSNKTLAECCQEIIDLKYKRGDIIGQTYLSYVSYVERFKRNGIGFKEVEKISPDDINNYFFKKVDNLSQGTKINDRKVMALGFKLAKDDKIITENPLESYKVALKAKKNRTAVTALTKEEQKRFLNLLNFSGNFQNYYPYSLAWLIEYYTGMRVSEVCALQWKDVDLECKNIWVGSDLSRGKDRKLYLKDIPKNQASYRNCHIVPELYDILKKEKEKGFSKKFLVTRDTINHVDTNYTTVALSKFNNKFKIKEKLSTHMLRHTFATNLIDSGVPSHIIQRALGHNSIKTTIDTYYTYFQKQNKQYDVAMDNIFAQIKED